MMLILFLLGCEPAPICDGLADVPLTNLALELTAEEHRTGWGNDQCFQCHQVWAIHAHDCTVLDGIDMAAIRDAIDPDDPGTCVPCHGSNGAVELGGAQ